MSEFAQSNVDFLSTRTMQDQSPSNFDYELPSLHICQQFCPANLQASIVAPDTSSMNLALGELKWEKLETHGAWALKKRCRKLRKAG
jgi:hypothetical protein